MVTAERLEDRQGRLGGKRSPGGCAAPEPSRDPAGALLARGGEQTVRELLDTVRLSRLQQRGERRSVGGARDEPESAFGRGVQARNAEVLVELDDRVHGAVHQPG